jgi:hydroxymethylglutaryl-CoA lyase
MTRQLLEAGCYEVSLGDTLGVGSPSDVYVLLKYLTGSGVPVEQLAGHFHDTYGQALANVWQAYQCGVRVFDSSVAGLGGCPFAPGAKGNVATEDLVYMFDRAGVSTGVDLGKLVNTGLWISDQLSQPTSSRAGAALAAREKPRISGPKSSPPALLWDLVRETDGLLLHRSGANLKVTMNRPRNGNALTSSMIAELTSTFTEASNDPTVNRVAITGRGKFFCTGMDLSKDRTPVGSDESSSEAQFQRLTALFEAIDNCSKTTISCLNGPAFGGGVGLAFCCDIRLFAKDATVTLSEAKLGLCPATISRYVIRELGIPFSREAMLTARPISPAELKTRGIIADIADDSPKLATLLDSTMRNLRVASPDASRMCKSLIKAGWAHGGQERQDFVIRELFQEMMKPDAPGSYGVKEFQAGRKVDWDRPVGLEISSKL